MIARREGVRKWFLSVVERFREKGAVSPDKAMTALDLGLPSNFEQAMKRRLGRLGVFVEVDGKYYLAEERLKQVEEWRARGTARAAFRRRMLTLRVMQLIAIIIFGALLLANLFAPSWELKVASAIFLVAWLAITAVLLYYVLRIWRHPRWNSRETETRDSNSQTTRGYGVQTA